MNQLLAFSILGALLVVSSPALAYGGSAAGSLGQLLLPLRIPASGVFTSKKKPIGHRKRVKPREIYWSSKTIKQAPELDPSAGGAAAVLMLGGTLVATGRRRREQPG